MELIIVNFYLMGILANKECWKKLIQYVELISSLYDQPLPHNYLVFGSDAFETATGVHAAAVIKAFKKDDLWLANRVYSGVPADVFGLEQKIRVGPMSGKSNVIYWLKQHNLEVSHIVIDKIFDRAKQTNKLLGDDEIMEIVEEF